MIEKSINPSVIERFSHVSPGSNVEEANRKFEEFFHSVQQLGKTALLHIPFKHVHAGPLWSYDPAIPHQTIVLAELNNTAKDLYVPSPYHRDAPTHQLIGMKVIGSLSELEGGMRLDVIPNESNAIYSLFTRLSHVYKNDQLAADIQVR